MPQLVITINNADRDEVADILSAVEEARGPSYLAEYDGQRVQLAPNGDELEDC